MRSFEASGLFCYAWNKESLCLNFGASRLVLALGLGLGLGLVVPEVARAACVPTPDCDSLGYTETSCPGTGVKCPWDTSKMFCGCGGDYVYSCSGTGYSGGSGTACGGKYTACTCDAGYEWSSNNCIGSCNVVGNILYSDMSCSVDLVNGRTPIGVCRILTSVRESLFS